MPRKFTTNFDFILRVCVRSVWPVTVCLYGNTFVSLLMGYSRTSFGFFQLLLAYGVVFSSLHSLIEWYSERDFHLNSVYYFNSSSLASHKISAWHQWAIVWITLAVYVFKWNRATVNVMNHTNHCPSAKFGTTLFLTAFHIYFIVIFALPLLITIITSRARSVEQFFIFSSYENRSRWLKSTEGT